MAKDLQWFKFKVSEWNDGEITLESFQLQGVFINICSYYWSKEGRVTLEILSRKFPVKSVNELVEKKFLKVTKRGIKVKFLEEQFNDREKNREKNRINGKTGGRPKTQTEPTDNPLGFPKEPNPKAIREEKRREEKERELALSNSINLFLKRKSQNTRDVQFMVQQWVEAGHTDILKQLQAMKACYQMQNLNFPIKIETLTESFMGCNWMDKLRELNPEFIAESISKAQRNGNQRPAEIDTIGVSEPGSLG